MTVFKKLSHLSRVCILCCGLLLAGCASVAGYQNLLQSWVGSPEARLLANWGVPTSIVNEGPVKLLTYFKQEGVYVTGYYGGWARPLFCTTTFTVNNGVVVNAQFRGNECVD